MMIKQAPTGVRLCCIVDGNLPVNIVGFTWQRDFSVVEPGFSGGANLLFGNIFAENFMKTKEIIPKRGWILSAPLGSATASKWEVHVFTFGRERQRVWKYNNTRHSLGEGWEPDSINSLSSPWEVNLDSNPKILSSSWEIHLIIVLLRNIFGDNKIVAVNT